MFELIKSLFNSKRGLEKTTVIVLIIMVVVIIIGIVIIKYVFNISARELLYANLFGRNL